MQKYEGKEAKKYTQALENHVKITLNVSYSGKRKEFLLLVLFIRMCVTVK